MADQDNNNGNRSDSCNGNGDGRDDDENSDHMDRLGLASLGIRRVSDISHINEIRREVCNKVSLYMSKPAK